MLLAAVGEGWCFLLNGISYIAVVVSLLAMRITRLAPPKKQNPALRELADGWKYVIESPAIRSILLLLGLVNMVGTPYTVLAPIVAGNVLHGDAHTLGFLMGASGVGALTSAISLALRRTVIGLGKMIAISSGMIVRSITW